MYLPTPVRTFMGARPGRGLTCPGDRSGDAAFGFAVGLYPTECPTLPDPSDDPGDRPS